MHSERISVSLCFFLLWRGYSLKSIVNSKEMKEIDNYSIQTIGIPSSVLMERAAMSISDAIMRDNRISIQSNILCCAGAGNNGGDAIAVARILHCYGYNTRVFMAGKTEKQTFETRLQLNICQKLGIAIEENLILSNIDVVIDGFFGIGINSMIRAPFDIYIKQINEWHQSKSNHVIYAVDMPSGISADHGRVMGEAICADVTVTFGYKKCGLVLYPGRKYAGSIFVSDIGFPKEALAANHVKGIAIEEKDLAILPERPSDSNKGSFGKVLIIGGKKNMSGAAYFAGAAAYRSGAGLVRILTPEANRIILQTLLPQAMIDIIEETDDDKITKLISWADVIVAGPGIGTEMPSTNIIRKFIEWSDKPLVMDADALNLLSNHPEWYEKLKQRCIITPHMGEMARLTGLSIEELKADRAKACSEFAKKHQIICILKDSSSVISDGKTVCYNETGNQGMAKGGSGDILAGMTGAIAAVNFDLFSTGCISAYIHGAAGDLASKEKGSHSMTADDLLDGLNCFFKKYKL